MIELFEQDIKTNDRQSSKGNQLKWKKNDIWYKADYTGYEGLVEYVVSELLKYTNLKENEYVIYTPVEMKYKTQTYRGAKSHNFLHDGWQIITLERLFMNKHGKSLNQAIWTIKEPKDRLSFIVNEVIKMTNLVNFGIYMNKILTLDAFFLNEDRHTHNIAVLMNENGDFDYCPIFDNGAGLLSDTTMDYPIDEDIYKLIDSVRGKTVSSDFYEQLEVSEKLYGANLSFKFTKKDVDIILSSNEALIYPIEIRQRVKNIIFEQMRIYKYMF